MPSNLQNTTSIYSFHLRTTSRSELVPPCTGPATTPHRWQQCGHDAHPFSHAYWYKAKRETGTAAARRHVGAIFVNESRTTMHHWLLARPPADLVRVLVLRTPRACTGTIHPWRAASLLVWEWCRANTTAETQSTKMPIAPLRGYSARKHCSQDLKYIVSSGHGCAVCRQKPQSIQCAG
jgi:hypothetical protein